jgi:hypothetical protein
MADATPPWAQPGVTDVATAAAFMATLRACDTLVLGSNDADAGYPSTEASQHRRGHGLTIAHNVVAATPPPADLTAHHRAFGLGATRVFCPRNPTARATLAELVLADDALVARIRADPSLRRVFVSFKSASAARLIAALGLEPVICDPEPGAYERANDKLALARAGRRHGFATLSAATATDVEGLVAAFRALSAEYGAGCILRLRRGAGGRHIHHAATERAARRIWQRLAAVAPEVVVMPYVPARRIRRNVAAHGVVTREGYAPFCLTDQIILHGSDFGGGAATAPWSAAEIAAVQAGLAGVARWFHEVGYRGAPAGVDGFLLDGDDGPRFVVLDPNARASATTGPWAAIATLMERAGRTLAWRLESFRLAGRPLDLDGLRRRLGADLLSPAAVERGGVLPTLLSARRIGPLAVTDLWAVLLGHDAEHVAHLRRRVAGLGIDVRRLPGRRR